MGCVIVEGGLYTLHFQINYTFYNCELNTAKTKLAWVMVPGILKYHSTIEEGMITHGGVQCSLYDMVNPTFHILWWINGLNNLIP